jgi:beta-N-acetylhexosaminidase
MEPALPPGLDELTEEDIRAAVGQLLVAGFEGADPTPPPAIKEALAQNRIGGVILFRRNVDTVEQVVELNERIHAAAEDAIEAPFVCVDQEGGRVVRLRDPLTPIPTMRALGRTGDRRLISEVSEVISTEIGALGFNVNFAPVLDVDTNPDNPIIGDRAFSDSAETVARCAGAYLLGHHTAGVVPCGKHFPGHGDTLLDSHVDLPSVEHDRERLDRVELLPFRRMITADIPMLMTAHIMVPEFDPDHPATLSRRIMNDLLRDEMGYEGVVVSDDLEMKAVADRYGVEEMLERGLRAGVDLFLICHTEEKWRAGYDHLVERALDDNHFLLHVVRAAERVRSLKQSYLGNLRRPWTRYDNWRDLLGCDEHREVMARVSDDGTDEAGDDPTEWRD